MRIAFYAPLKPPGHPAPSGDRRMARLLLRAIKTGGHTVEVASRLRTYDGTGDGERQHRLQVRGHRTAAKLIDGWRGARAAERPDLWFTYHLYHKAPDWLGPAVAAALGIPYVVAEASFAPKQANGPWKAGHDAVARALAVADLVFELNSADAGGVKPLLKTYNRLVPLPPFLDTAPYVRAAALRGPHRARLAKRYGLDTRRLWLITAAMMRPGDKLSSYRVLAKALTTLTDRNWQLLVAGGGAAERDVHAAFAGLEDRVTWLGPRTPQDLAAIYASGDIYVWPAVREAYGMAFLEAQAGGLPVIASWTGGVPDIVTDGETGLLAPEGDAGGFAAATRALIDDAAMRGRMSNNARRAMLARHSLPAAAQRLDSSLTTLLKKAG